MRTSSRRRFLQSAAAATVGLAVTPKSAPAAGPDYAIQGIDVSRWQSTVNWMAVRRAGITFAFCKATEGTSYTDPEFAANWKAMKANRIVRGAYHYGRPGTDAVTQANFFYSTVQPSAGDLQLVLDLETTDSKTPAEVRAWTVAFINRLTTLCGRPGIIYCGYYFWRDQAGNGNNLGCPLWIPAYRDDLYNPVNLIAPAWSTWSFWQYTDTGSVGGVTGNCDRNAWNGSAAALNNLRLP